MGEAYLSRDQAEEVEKLWHVISARTHEIDTTNARGMDSLRDFLITAKRQAEALLGRPPSVELQ